MNNRFLFFLCAGLVCLFIPMDISAQQTGIVLSPGAESLLVRKNPADDCRVVRGFNGGPVDGSVRSWTYIGWVAEYPGTSREFFDPITGVNYRYNGNDGVHVTLHDARGFDAVVLRGGANTRMYTESASIEEPSGAAPGYVFPGGDPVSVVRFPRRQATNRASFFGTVRGRIADVGFFQIEERSGLPEGAEVYSPASDHLNIPIPRAVFAPEDIYHAMNDRYGDTDWIAHSLVPDNSSSAPKRLRAGQALHCITEPFRDERGLLSMSFDLVVAGPSEEFTLTAVVQDPLDPRLDLMWVPFRCRGGGRYSFTLDIPDQVLLKGSRLWATLICDRDAVLSGPGGGGPKIHLSFADRSAALDEAVRHRMFLLKHFFQLLCEPRPWGALRKDRTFQEFFSGSGYEKLCPELFMTIDQCHALAPDNPLLRQYREWVYLGKLATLSEIAPPPSPPAGVPAWAWYPRLAWLETRRMAEWWIENRMTPNGEFGSGLGDDSDLYQQFLDLPFFENDGVGGKLRDGAVQLAELANEEFLREGVNRFTADALHAYEEGINHTALISSWCYGDPIYLERCMESARSVERMTLETPDGGRLFPTTRNLGYDTIANPPDPEVDGGASALLWHTALQAADYNRNPRIIRVMRQWADTWLAKMKPDDWPIAIDVKTGRVVDYAGKRPLSGGYNSQACTFHWLYTITGDLRYISPFLNYYTRGEAPRPADQFLQDVYVSGGLDSFGKSEVDRLAEFNPFVHLYRAGSPDRVIGEIIGTPASRGSAITNLYDATRWPDMYTASEQFTDRVLPSILSNAAACYLGGIARRNKYNPVRAVSWEGLGTDYGALVLDNHPTRLRAAVYNYSGREQKGNLRVWALEHGEYEVVTGVDADDDFTIDRGTKRRTVELAKSDALAVTLPAQKVTIIEIRQKKRLDPIETRADLALAAREITVRGNRVSGVVHNIGSTDAHEVVVALTDARGKVLDRKSLGSLAAPNDLVAKRMSFDLTLPSNAGRGWKVAVDPGNLVPEIYEGNNTVRSQDTAVRGR